MNRACLFLGILFLAAGIYFYSGKAVNHIAAWKTMPEEEKRKIHIRPLCRNVGMMIATSGIIFLLSGAWYAFRKSGFLWCMVGWMVLSGADVYWIGKSGRYLPFCRHFLPFFPGRNGTVLFSGWLKH